MTEAREMDVQAQEISEGLRNLIELLDKPLARNALDLAKNAITAARYDVLRRLRQSLLQYLGREGDLFYVGFLGHFSAGKSSTINSLLQAHKTKHQRATGLNPTDTTITLITQGKNSNSLLGVIREGHVTIRHQAMESPMLDNLVLVDTPGTGDPQFMEEVARDFLPICDVILFFLSAASPLDKSDLPLLSELHKRLPFIPLNFVITRADELRHDFNIALSEQNLDPARTSQFLGEVVGRINTLLKPQVYRPTNSFSSIVRPALNIAKLRTFLESRCNSSSPHARATMHVNKLHFYHSGAKELRDFFATFLDTKLVELNKILTSASRNIQKYQEIVKISNSNLTKAWLDHNSGINQAQARTTEPLKPLSDLPEDYTTFSSAIRKRADVTGELLRDARFAANSISTTLRSEVISNLQDHFYKTQKTIGDPLEDLTATSRWIKSVKFSHEFSSSDLISPSLLSRRCADLRDSLADALRDATSDLRRATKDLDELLLQRVPFADCELTVDAAKGVSHERSQPVFSKRRTLQERRLFA